MASLSFVFILSFISTDLNKTHGYDADDAAYHKSEQK